MELAPRSQFVDAVGAVTTMLRLHLLWLQTCLGKPATFGWMDERTDGQIDSLFFWVRPNFIVHYDSPVFLL